MYFYSNISLYCSEVIVYTFLVFLYNYKLVPISNEPKQKF